MIMPSPSSIAILLATYNGERFIGAFFDSLLAQTASDVTVYVRDDGSTDATLAIVAEYARRMAVVVMPASQRLGPAHSFMALLHAASEQHAFFAFADQDDVWASTKLQRARSTLSVDGDVPSLYFARVEYVDEQLMPLGFSTMAAACGFSGALVENVAMGCTMMINRSARALVLDGRPASLTMHDWWVYLVVSAFGRVHADDYIALKYRQHANNAVGGTASIISEYFRKIAGFLQRDPREVTISQQASELSKHYGHLLSGEQKTLVDSLQLAATVPSRRLALCLRSPFRRQRPIDTVILRVLFLLGRF